MADDDLNALMPKRRPTPDKPFLGMTFLAVEDSRFACEALRLLCLRSGARIRRADRLASAERHLQTYRPEVALIDHGLPDGSGATLIRKLSEASAKVPIILGMSGDSSTEADMLAAGANGFILKPLNSIAAFQQAVLRHLPRDRHPRGLRCLSKEFVEPDPLALRDDLNLAADMLSDTPSEPDLGYVAQFVTSISASAKDTHLEQAAEKLSKDLARGSTPSTSLPGLQALLAKRLEDAHPF